MIILAIDPAPLNSGYCIIDSDNYKPLIFGKIENNSLMDLIKDYEYNHMAIEMIASMGMVVGASVFDTCVWIGRFIQSSKSSYSYIYRKDEKMNLCGSMKAKDSNIRQALIDRFGEVGTKNNQGWFYGFKADIWSAYAVGVTYLDLEQSKNEDDL
jgi:hypothetical protein